MNGRYLSILAALAAALTVAPRPASAQQSKQRATAHLVTGGALEGPTQVVLGALPQMTAEQAVQPFGDVARGLVGGRARAERHDEAERAVGKRIGARARSRCDRGGSEQDGTTG